MEGEDNSMGHEQFYHTLLELQKNSDPFYWAIGISAKKNTIFKIRHIDDLYLQYSPKALGRFAYF